MRFSPSFPLGKGTLKEKHIKFNKVVFNPIKPVQLSLALRMLSISKSERSTTGNKVEYQYL